MTKKAKPAASAGTTKQKITLERTFRATMEDAWDLWTTREGLESWWGPEGFVTTVHELDIRPGGMFEYQMTATAPARSRR